MGNWRKNIREISPYIPGERAKGDGVIKLNTNENPYPPSIKVKEALDKMDINEARLYPDPELISLREKLASYHKLDKEQIFVGVGSDDVIAIAFMTFFNSDLPILFPDITYSFYPVWADLFKIPYENPKLDENFRIIKEDYYVKNGGIIIANPNAPTGIYEGENFIRDILKNNTDSIVIIDEAYIDFAEGTSRDLIEEFDNLLVIQTFSKSRSMAGIRIGYAMGNSELIAAMEAVKFSYNSYTLNLPSIVMGIESIKEEDYFREKVDKIINTREETKAFLKKLGFEFFDSKANFVFAKHPKYKAKDLFTFLKENHRIYTRHFNSPRIEDYLRISIGTDEEMKKLNLVLKEVIK